MPGPPPIDKFGSFDAPPPYNDDRSLVIIEISRSTLGLVEPTIVVLPDIFENNMQISTSKLLTILEATSFDSLVFSKEIVSMITLYLPIFEDLAE